MMGPAGVGASSHLAGLQSVSLTQIQSTHMPYKGGGPIATAIVTNEAQWAISPAAALVGLTRAGRLRAIAIASARRSPILPDLPTASASGVPAYEFRSWNGVSAPAGIPRSIIQQVDGVMVKTAAMNDVKEQFASQGLAPSANASPEAFAQLIRADYTTIGKVVKVAGIKPE